MVRGSGVDDKTKEKRKEAPREAKTKGQHYLTYGGARGGDK